MLFFSRSQKCKQHQSAPDEEVEDVIVMVMVVTEVVLEDAVVEDVLVLEDVVVVVVPQLKNGDLSSSGQK